MMRFVRSLTALVAALELTGATAAAAPQNPTPPSGAGLCYSGGGYWRLRLTVRVRNDAAVPLAGFPIPVRISPDDLSGRLIGLEVGALRVVGPKGSELIFGFEDARGGEKHSGRIAAGDRLVLPVEAPARGEAAMYVFADNPSAWRPPEWLGSSRLVNLSFEETTADGAPVGWSAWGVDEQHRMAVQEGAAHSGRRCARCDVAPGARATWVKYWQGSTPVFPGEKYRFTAWVKAENVKGRAGWYVHVDGERPLMVNRVEGWDGTYDWRKVTIEFEAPDGASEFSCGTVLYGTGRAWYDDAKLERIGGGPRPRVRVVSAERIELRRIGAEAPWLDLPRWNWRVPIVVRNFADHAENGILVEAALHRALNALAKQFGFAKKPRFRLIDPERPQRPAPLDTSSGTTVRFAASVPAKSEKTFFLYAGRRRDAPDPSPTDLAPARMFAEANLVANPDMEEGDASVPAVWNAGEEGRSGRRFQARRVRKGRSGKWCLELMVPETIREPGWCGWRQKVRVQPGKTYMLGGWIRTRGVDGAVRIHGHFLREDGTLTEHPFFSTTPTCNGDTDWTWTSATVTTPPDCAFIEVHLTMNCHGTVYHDGVVLAPILPAYAGGLETRKKRGRKLAWWIVNPRVKVFPDDLPPDEPHTKARVAVCRNGRRILQAAFRAEAPTRMTLRASALRGPNGAVLDPPELWAVGYVPVDFPIGYDSNTEPAWRRHHPNNRGNDGWPGLWPDPMTPLRPDGTVSLEPGVTRAFVADVRVPADALPGEYKGELTATTERRTVRIPVVLRVWRMVLPPERHLPALYDLRNGPGHKAFALADSKSEAVEIWYRFLAQYNVSPSFVIPSPTFRYKNGRVEMDAVEFDRAARLLFDELHVPRVYTPHIFYACGWAYPPKKIFGLEPFSDEYVNAWKSAYRQFVDHITEKGWRKRFVFYISDEPDGRSEVTIQGIARIADMAREIAPNIPIYSSTWRYIDGLAGHITLWGMGPQGSFAPDKVAERRKAGDHFWYTTDGQMCLDTPYLGIEYLLPWFCHKYGAEAYEFWGVSWWTWNTWEYGWHSYIRQSHEGKIFRWVRYPNGDGFLAYPPRDLGKGRPLPSIRLVAAREGVDDYELLLALDRVAAQGNRTAEKLLEKVHALVTSPNRGGRWSTVVMPDPEAVEDLRTRIGDFLDKRERDE